MSDKPQHMSIAEMRQFMSDLVGCLQHSSTRDALAKEYPGTACVAMPRSDCERLGQILQFFKAIEPHADDVRRAVFEARKRLSS